MYEHNAACAEFTLELVMQRNFLLLYGKTLQKCDTTSVPTYPREEIAIFVNHHRELFRKCEVMINNEHDTLTYGISFGTNSISMRMSRCIPETDTAANYSVWIANTNAKAC